MLLTLLFVCLLSVKSTTSASTDSTTISPERAFRYLQIRELEDCHPSTPEYPGFLPFLAYQDDIDNLICHFELNLEVLISSGVYRRPIIRPHVSTWVYWLWKLMPAIHLRFVKKMFKTYVATADESMMLLLSDFADQVEGDNDVSDLLDEPAVQGSFRHELMDRLSDKG